MCSRSTDAQTHYRVPDCNLHFLHVSAACYCCIRSAHENQDLLPQGDWKLQTLLEHQGPRAGSCVPVAWVEHLSGTTKKALPYCIQ